jgi:hypothetical protein
MIRFLSLATLLAVSRFLPSIGTPPVTPIPPPAAAGSMAPNLTSAGNRLLLSWLEPTAPGSPPGDGEMAVRFASFDGSAWSAPATIVRSDRIFANWADFPALAVSRRGWMLAGWPEKSGGGEYDYFLELARAAGPEGSWRRLGPAHEDRGGGEHGFVSFVPEGDGIRAFWLDGRDAAGETGSMALRTALVADSVGPSEVLDARVCDCCQTSAAVTSEGPIVAFRDRSGKETRDIAVARRTSGRWSKPRAVAADGWTIAGCPVNGPAVAASGREVAVAWFTAAGDAPRVRMAFSKDAGETFGKPVEIDGEAPAGRVDLTLDATGDALLSWVAVSGKAAEIRVRRVTPGGRAGAAVTVAPTSVARSSGFPRIERLGADLVLAWVEASEPFRLRAARFPARAVPAPSPR